MCMKENKAIQSLMCSCAVLISIMIPCWAQDRSSPEATVRSFLSAFERGDLKQAAACVKGKALSDQALAAKSREVKADPVTFTLSGLKSVLNGGKATVTAEVGIKTRSGAGPAGPSSTTLISEGGVWLIAPDAARAQREAKPDIINGLAFMLASQEMAELSLKSAQQVACLSNMKQIALGAIMLAQDSNEKYALSAASFKRQLMPYLKNASIFTCPAVGGTAVSYAFNASLANVAIGKISNPATTVLFYEGRGGKLAYRHNGKAGIAFADGHAKMVTEKEAAKLRWKP